MADYFDDSMDTENRHECIIDGVTEETMDEYCDSDCAHCTVYQTNNNV